MLDIVWILLWLSQTYTSFAFPSTPINGMHWAMCQGIPTCCTLQDKGCGEKSNQWLFIKGILVAVVHGNKSRWPMFFTGSILHPLRNVLSECCHYLKWIPIQTLHVLMSNIINLIKDRSKFSIQTPKLVGFMPSLRIEQEKGCNSSQLESHPTKISFIRAANSASQLFTQQQENLSINLKSQEC